VYWPWPDGRHWVRLDGFGVAAAEKLLYLGGMSVERAAVLCPGRNFGPHAPWLYYAGMAARNRGAEVTSLEWQDTGSTDAVLTQVRLALDGIESRTPPLLICKSLGSRAAVLAARRNLPAIWLTPLLREDVVAEAIRSATAPCLLVGGTADPLAWDGKLARELSPHVCELPGADHGLAIPEAPLAATIDAIGTVVTAIESFLDEVVWPDGTDRHAE
jgi:pimeloyl-ACP methyl ester carboxylesterase